LYGVQGWVVVGSYLWVFGPCVALGWWTLFSH